MYLCDAELKKRIADRMSDELGEKSSNLLYSILIDIMKEKLLDYKPIIISGFGTFFKKVGKKRRYLKGIKGEGITSRSIQVKFEPAYQFAKYLEDIENRKLLRNRIVRKINEFLEKRNRPKRKYTRKNKE